MEPSVSEKAGLCEEAGAWEKGGHRTESEMLPSGRFLMTHVKCKANVMYQ